MNIARSDASNVQAVKSIVTAAFPPPPPLQSLLLPLKFIQSINDKN